MKIIVILLAILLQLMAVDREHGNTINKVNAATVNTLLIFTSQEGLNSGKYTFTNTPANITMDIYHLPVTYNFKSNSALNYFFVGNVGYSQIYLDGNVEQLPPDVDLNYSNHIQTYTGGIGGGIRYEIMKYLSVSGGMEIIYSRSGLTNKPGNSSVGDKLDGLFDKDYSNNLSYKIFTLLEYRPVVYDFKPYVTLGYKVFETKSEISAKEVFSFDSESSVTSLSLGVESPKLYSFDEQNITIEAYIIAHYLGGVVRKVVDFQTYRSIGAIAYYNTPEGPWWTSRFFLEANTVNSDGLNGYNFGMGFTVDF